MMFLFRKGYVNLTLKSSPVQNQDVHQAMIPYVHIQDRNSYDGAYVSPSLFQHPPLASETPRYCAGASLKV